MTGASATWRRPCSAGPMPRGTRRSGGQLHAVLGHRGHGSSVYPGRVSRPAWPIGLGVLAAVVVACGGGSNGTDRGAEGGGAAPGDTATADAATVDSLAPGTYAYMCPDGPVFSATVEGDSASLEIGIREVTLARVPAASGARYEGSDVVFRSRGSEATLQVGASVHRACEGVAASSPWEKAELLGIEFRALGQEPGWILDIHPDRWIRYIGDYGETRLLLPPVDPVGDSAGTLTYRAETEAHALTAVIREEPCRDAMSGHAFSHTVAITVDGRQLRGCGRRLAERWGGR